MPLLDHFHPPASLTHSWESFHATWVLTIAGALNQQLAPTGRYLAEVQVTVGTRVEADVAEFELPIHTGNGETGGVAVATWAPPAARQTIPASFPDDIEVQVFKHSGGKKLVAVVELVSPANKDRSEHRRAFAAKSVAYLRRGIGLIVIDIVTERRPHLHREIMGLLGQEEAERLADLYAVAYHPARREEKNLIDLWPVSLAVGEALPTLGLALRGAFFVPVDLEATYAEARQRSLL